MIAPAPSLTALAEVASPETIRAVLELLNVKAYVEAQEKRPVPAKEPRP